MSRLVWLTDLHLNFATDIVRDALLIAIRNERPDHLLVGGDIAEAPSFVEELEWLSGGIGCPVWFVLGNHDYYRGSIADVRQQAEHLTQTSPTIGWLPACGVVPLTDQTALIGHGGWGDARAGNWDTTSVMLNDYALIDELRSMPLVLASKIGVAPDPRAVLDDKLRQRLNGLGDEAAARLSTAAEQALSTHRQVFVLMHVPPFLEACWHDGRITDENWSPHFVCAAAGDALRNLMTAHPDRTMTILCGHTHSEGTAQILPNLTVLTGDAQYGLPTVQQVFDVSK